MSTFQLQEFDRDDIANCGRPNFFSLDDYFGLIQQYITADEIAKAMWLLDNPPEFYKENQPLGTQMIRDQIYRRLFTSLQYAKDGCKIEDTVNQPITQTKAGVGLERGKLTFDCVSAFNADDETPWLYELAPGSYWLPLMLKAHDLKFEYHGPSLNAQMQDDIEVALPNIWRNHPYLDQKKVFIAFELIEHLLNPEEIYHHYVKAGSEFDTILLSTPRGTFGGGRPDWHEADLGHVQTYMPKSFITFAQKHWPFYKWQLFDGPVMMLRGDK